MTPFTLRLIVQLTAEAVMLVLVVWGLAVLVFTH